MQELTHSQTSTGAAVEVEESMNNFNPYFIFYAITDMYGL